MAFEITSERLHIRPWRADDRDAFRRFTDDTQMMQFISAGKPWNEDRLDEFFDRQARSLAGHGCCFGAATDRHTGELLGVSGVQPLGDGRGELGWWIARENWGRGLATEGGIASRDYALDVLGMRQLIAVADPQNTASLRIMEKLGMRSLGLQRAGDFNPRYGDMMEAVWVLDGPASERPVL